MTLEKVHEGLNESNRPIYLDVSATDPADNASWTVTLPASLQGKGVLPCVRAVYTYGAGAIGARTATYRPILDVGSSLVGVEVVSFVEATGVLTLTNRTGGGLTAPRVVFEVLTVD